VLNAIDADVDSGGNPVAVAKKVYEIMQRKHPKVHYTVGEPLQRLSVLLKRVLPGRWFERLLASHVQKN